jgi:hypothetical protein
MPGKLPRGRRTLGGRREIEVKVTRDRRGRTQVRDAANGQYTKLMRTARRESEKVDRVDKRLKFGAQTNGWWFIPPGAGGTHNWVRQGKEPTTIRGYHYKPGQSFPVTGPNHPGPLDEHGRPYAPYGVPLSSAVPADVWAASSMFSRSFDPSTFRERIGGRLRRLQDAVLGEFETPPRKGVRRGTVRRKAAR